MKGDKIMAALKLGFDCEIPSLQSFEPQQTVRALWEIFKDYDDKNRISFDAQYYFSRKNIFQA